MIYLDVTSSCKSPMNTGVQRAVRGLYRALSRTPGVAVTPVLWEPRLADYCRLSARERGFLEAPFAGRTGRRARGEPGRVANPVPGLSKLWRQVVHRRNRLGLAARLRAQDTVFIPEIFQDNRIAWLRELRGQSQTSAQCVAVFHDAIAWKRPDITPAARYAGFAEYMAALGESFDGVVAVSEEAAEDLRGFWNERVQTPLPALRVIGWPAEGSARKVDGEVKEAATGSSFRSPQVLCVGTFEPRKNHLALLAAAEEIWRAGVAFSLVLIGRTTAAFGHRVEAEIARLRASNHAVEWRRHVSDTALLAAYQECAFTVFPSLVEGYGLPIVESLVHGKPVICGGNGALGELARGGGCLVVDQTDPHALAEGVRSLLTDAALRERLAAEARQRRFPTWQEYAADLLPILTPAPAARRSSAAGATFAPDAETSHTR